MTLMTCKRAGQQGSSRGRGGGGGGGGGARGMLTSSTSLACMQLPSNTSCTMLRNESLLTTKARAMGGRTST